MYIKNSLSLFINNVNLSFKAMLYRLIVASVFTALIAVICDVNMSVITKSAELKDFFDSIRGAISGFLGADYSFGKNVAETYGALIALIKENVSSIIGVSIVAFLLIYVETFLLGVSHFALTYCVNSHMASLTKTGFFEALFSSLKVSAPFEALYAAIKNIVVILTLALSGLFAVYTMEFLSIFSLIISTWLLIFIFSMYLTVTVLFRPNVVNGAGVGAAFKTKFEGKKFWTCFGSFVLSFTVGIIVNVASFLTTFGAGLIISLPLTALFFACLKLVVYYNVNNKKYYIDIDHIVTPVTLREDGELLDKVDAE